MAEGGIRHEKESSEITYERLMSYPFFSLHVLRSHHYRHPVSDRRVAGR